MKTKKQIFVIIFKMVAILFLSTISNSSFAGFPAIQWKGCYGGFTPGGISNIDYGFCIQQTIDGGYIAIGSTNSIDGNAFGGGYHGSSPSYLKDVWVLRLDSLGNILWQKCYGGTGIDEGKFIIQTKDGGFAFIATTNSTDFDLIIGGSTLKGLNDVWVVKLTSLGVVTWQKCYGGIGDETALCITQSLVDSSYFLSSQTAFASSNTGDVGLSNGSLDAWVVKINSLGVIQWQKCLGGNFIDVLNSVVATKDSGSVLCGSTNSTIPAIGFHGGSGSDGWVVKLTSLGVITWQKILGGTRDDKFFSIKKTFSNGYAISGYTQSVNGDALGSNMHGVSPFPRDVWFIKLSSNGNLQFQQCYGGTKAEEGNCIVQTLDSCFVIASIAISTNDGDVGQNNGLLGTTNDVWLLKLDSSGVLKYQKCYGSSQDENRPWVIQSRDKGYIFITYSFDPTGDVAGCPNPNQYKGSTDIFIVKLMDPLPPLPINLISFKAKTMKDKVQLTWSTASEIINNYFSIEKSIDGYNYQEIGQVSGAGNSNEVLSYSFFDTSPSFGISYYRLSQTDYNGTKETFAPVPVTYYDEKNVSKIAIYNLMGQPLDVDINSLNSLSSGMYLIISYDKDANILSKVKFFKQ